MSKHIVKQILLLYINPLVFFLFYIIIYNFLGSPCNLSPWVAKSIEKLDEFKTIMTACYSVLIGLNR